MGMKHRVDSGIYECYGSINPQLAERTGFTDADADVIKAILPKLFENDASSARPDGSMQVAEGDLVEAQKQGGSVLVGEGARVPNRQF